MERLLPERFRDRHATYREGYFAAPRFRPMGAGLALFARRRDGSEFPVEISLSPIDGSDRPLVAAAIRDVTERKRAEAELSAAREAAERARGRGSRCARSRTRLARAPIAPTRPRAAFSPPPATICASPCRRSRCSTAHCGAW